MAKDAKAAAESAAQSAPKKSKKLLIIILAVVFLLVAGGGAALFLLKGGGEHEDDDEVAEAPAKKKGKEHPPIFLTLEPFTVNLAPENGDQYLQVTVAVEVHDPEAEQTLKLNMPKIRNDLTLLLSSKKASELLTKEGKETLASELCEAINDVIQPPHKNKKGEMVRGADAPAKAVLFTSFIIQ